MSPRLTDWFAPKRLPTRVGYYDTRTSSGEMVLFWDGRNWRASEHSPRPAFESHFWQRREWRGLVEKLGAVSPTAAHAATKQDKK